MKRDIKHFLVSSNAFFLLPLSLSLYSGLYLHALSVLICIIGSVMYHQSKETEMDLVDKYTAIQLICANCILLGLGGFKHQYVYIIIGLVVLAFYCKWLAEHKSYTLWHSVWHIVSALITVAATLSYVGF